MYQQTGLFSFRKRIRQLEMKRNAKMNLGASSFFLTEKKFMRNSNWLLWNQKIEVINKKCYIYNVNNELDQVKTLTELSEILNCVDDIQNKNIILGSNFNIVFDSFLEAQVGKLILKKHVLAKTIQIK